MKEYIAVDDVSNYGLEIGYLNGKSYIYIFSKLRPFS